MACVVYSEDQEVSGGGTASQDFVVRHTTLDVRMAPLGMINRRADLPKGFLTESCGYLAVTIQNSRSAESVTVCHHHDGHGDSDSTNLLSPFVVCFRRQWLLYWCGRLSTQHCCGWWVALEQSIWG